MQVQVQARLDTVKDEQGKDTAELNGGIVLSVEWVPSSEHEAILLKHLLASDAHETATAEPANFGEKLISTIRLQSDKLADARAEMALFSAWKQAGEMYQGQIVSFDRFKELKSAEVPVDVIP